MPLSAPTFRPLRRVSVALLFALALFAAPRMHAQATGDLSGNVTDNTHALVPDALIVLTSEERGNKLTIKSNTKGEYSFHDLAVGTYTLRVTANGFSAFESHHITIDADSRFRVDAELKTGTASDIVEVNADAVAVDTQSGVVQQVIDNELVENLPIDGNNVVALASLLPGVTDVNAPTTFTDENGGSSYSANGARGNSNLYLFDGLLWNNLFLNTGINYPNHAVLHQVSVQLNNFSAQYGRNSGSIFNVVSKTGSNTVHGELFFHYHDSMFDAKNYFSRKKNPQHTYQFGGVVGGPIIRDKLFYELEYQSLVGNEAFSAGAETLTMAERGLNADGSQHLCIPGTGITAATACADFSGDVKAGGDPNKLIINPVYASPSGSGVGTYPAAAITQLNSTWAALGHTGTNPCITTLQGMNSTAGYLQNAQIPYECLDPTVQNIIKAGYIPVPDTKLGSSQFLYATTPAAQPSHEYGGFARVDYNVTARQQMAFRYFHTDVSDLTSLGATSSDYGVPTYEPDENAAFITAGSVSHTLVVTPNLLNNIILGYKRYEYGVIPSDTRTLNSFGSLFTRPGYQSLPYLNIETRFHLGSTQNAFTHSVNENIELLDNVTWTRGRQSFLFGTDYLHLQYLNKRTNVGTFTFEGNPGYTGSQGADFMMGLIYSESVGNGQTISAIQNATYNYLEDTWRILPRLTLTLGARYELPFMWYQPKGESATFIRGYQSQKFKNAPAGLAFVGDQGVPRSLVKTDFTNISPRIGFAYDIFGDGKTAVRGGFGTFYDAVPAVVVGLTQPYTYRAFYQAPNIVGSITDPLNSKPAIPADFSPGNATFPGLASITYPDANFKNAYVYGFNIGIHRQISKGSIFEVNYLGRLARKLIYPADQNPQIVDCSGVYYQSNPTLYCPTAPTTGYGNRSRYPGFNYGGSGVLALKAGATANYHALQVIYRQRAYKNLTILSSYSYSKTLDEVSSFNVTTPSNVLSKPDDLSFDYARSSQDARHILNMGWRLGFGRVNSSYGWVKQVANGWAFNGIFNARTGHPLNITFGGDQSGTDEPTQRAYLIPGMNPNLPSNRHRRDKINAWFDPNAFRKPDAFAYSNISRNFLTSPAYLNTQMSITKAIDMAKVRKGMRGQFRAEAFNVWNTVNLGTPRTTFSSSSGQATTFGSINSEGSNGHRRIQFGYIQYF